METVLHGKVDTALSSPHQVLYHARSKTYKPCNNVNAGYFKDGKHCWISDGSTLTILKHGSSYIESYSNFERYFEGFNVKITCCKKYKNYLLVGLKTSDEKGYVCLHYPNIGRNLKTIEFPYPVTSLEVILTEGGANTSSVGFSQKLRWLFGVVAVGTEGGHIYLLDLRLDEEIDILRHKCHISNVEAVPTVVRDVPRLRDEVNQQKSHLAFELIESSHENGSFHYITMDDQIIETFDSNDISVSSMYFEPRATSLFVGFSFGQFHIFCLKSLSLVFSSDTQQYASAVVKFAFQEPENDPRNFCYLWLVKQSMLDEETNENTMNATMYQLMFQHKEVVHTPNSITSLYSNLECCSARFELILDATLGVKPMPGRSHLLQCTSVEHYCPMNRILNEEDKEENSTPDTSLLILGWGTITGGESRNVQVIVFDINRWYVCHMPSCYRVYDDEANYLVFWELDSVLPTCNSDLLCIHTPTSSLTRFKSKQHPCPELFLLPSSLSLTTNILLSDQTITCKMPGIQKQVMQFLSNGRLHCLLEPDETFQQMMLVGLIEQTNIVAMTVDRKREMILSAALDHGLFGFLSRVISDLSSGEHAGSGCSLRFIMEWAWKTVAIIKDSIDNLCVPIFDCGGVPLDVSVHNLLAFHNSQLSDIGLVFKKLLRQAISSSEQSKLEMGTKVNVVQLIRDYLKVLRWFISARLLPEQWEAPQDVVTSDDFAFIYKHDELGSIFKERRSELGKLQRAQSSGSSESSSLLMIDGLIEDAGEGLLSRWKKLSESDDSCCYPPPSLMALLDMYYLDSMSDTSKHCIVTYFLLDMLAMHETMEDQESERSEEFIAMKNEHLQTVGLFPERFQLQHPTTKLIKAFWLLDHKEFHDSIRMFCEAGSSCPSLPWQHRRILLAYLLQGHHDLALRYLLTCQPPTLSEEDVKLKIDIYVKNNLPLLGLETVKINSEPDNQFTLFSHLFTSCHEQHLLKDLINLSVSKEEDDLVLKVLQSNVIPNSHEMLVFYHLHKSRHVEAIKAYHTNKHRYMMTEHNESTKKRHSKMNQIIQGYMNVIPEMYRDIAMGKEKPYERNVMAKKEAFHGLPLSAILNSRKPNTPLSHAALMRLVMENSKPKESQTSDSPFRTKLKSQKATKPERRESKLFFPNDVTTSVKKTHMQGNNPTTQVANLLLQTPPIKRRSKMRTPTTGGVMNFDLMTPQSILKVKLLKEKSPSLPCVSNKSIRGDSTVASGSLTSFIESEAGVPRYSTLDSSGSEGDLPQWLSSAMTSQRQFSSQPITVEQQKPHFNMSMFTIATPPAKELVKNFKGIPKIGTAEEKPPASFTPKRLRFSCLNTSDNEQSDDIKMADEETTNMVVISPGDEDIDVDVTGVFTDSYCAKNQDKETPMEDDVPMNEDSDTSDVLYVSSDDVVTPDEDVNIVIPGPPHLAPDVSVPLNAPASDPAQEDVNIVIPEDHPAAPPAPEQEDVGTDEVARDQEEQNLDETSSPFTLRLSESSSDISKPVSDEKEEEKEDDIKLFVSSDNESNFSDASLQISEDEDPLFQSSLIRLNNEESNIQSSNDHLPPHQLKDEEPPKEETGDPPSADDGDLHHVFLAPQEEDTQAEHVEIHDMIEEEIVSNPPDEERSEEVILPSSETWKETDIIGETSLIFSMQPPHPGGNDSETPLEPITDISSETEISKTSSKNPISVTSSENSISRVLSERTVSGTSSQPSISLDVKSTEETNITSDGDQQMISDADHSYAKVESSSEGFGAKETTLSDHEVGGKDEKIEVLSQEPTIPCVKSVLPKPDLEPKPAPKTPKILKEPVFILSPPTTRSRRQRQTETPKSVKKPSTSPMSLRNTSQAKTPHQNDLPFVFSPPTTRGKSRRKRIHLEDQETTPSKTRRVESPPGDEKIKTKPPIPTSSRKARKSTGRNSKTPTRSSARVKLLKVTTSEDEELHEGSPPQSKKSPVLTPSRNLRGRKPSKEILEENPSSVSKTPSRRGAKSQTTDIQPPDEDQPVVKNTSSRRKRESVIPEKIPAHSEPPLVTRTSSRRRTTVSKDSSDEVPTVARTSSRRRHTRVVDFPGEEPASVSRSRRKKGVSSDESEVVGKTSKPRVSPKDEEIHLFELPEKPETPAQSSQKSKKEKATKPSIPIRTRRTAKLRVHK